uniref:Uncharacterized protein n=1 Tax=Anguilla anguilla TaxID=7936 RepID=A0A0E9XX67_ANGAN
MQLSLFLFRLLSPSSWKISHFMFIYYLFFLVFNTAAKLRTLRFSIVIIIITVTTTEAYLSRLCPKIFKEVTLNVLFQSLSFSLSLSLSQDRASVIIYININVFGCLQSFTAERPRSSQQTRFQAYVYRQ